MELLCRQDKTPIDELFAKSIAGKNFLWVQKINIIQANNLCCNYSVDEAEIKGILVDKLLIPRVGITSIIGVSGSGKSTLLSLLSGARRPTQLQATQGWNLLKKLMAKHWICCGTIS